MKPVVALPVRSQKTLLCEEARQMLLCAGFQLRCNETGRHLDGEELKAMICDAFAVVAGTEKYSAQVLTAAPNLKAVIRFGVGTDNFDMAAMAEKGLEVGTITNHDSVAEFALTLMLSLI